MDSDLKELCYQSALESPGAWLLQAMTLKAAADRLDPYAFPARDDEDAIWFGPQYCMLLGMSFETMLKGLIAFQRLDSGLPPSELPAHHELERLARMPECAFVTFTPGEIDVLRELTPFIVWGGRYPIPLKAEKYEARAHGTKRQAAASALWTRLFVILRDSGWIMKGGPSSKGGFRLYTKPKGTP